MHPIVFRFPLGLCRQVVEYQVRQSPRGADVTVRCGSRTDLRALEGEIAAKLAAAGVAGAEVTVTAADTLPRQQTGKLKRFVPLAPTPVAA